MRTFFESNHRFLYRLMAFLLAVLFLSMPLSSCTTVVGREALSLDSVPVFNELEGGDKPVDSNRPRVAITFDDGPNHYQNRTKNYVDELLKYGYTATFFVVGYRVAGGDAVKYAVDNGMEIGIHGYTHDVYYSGCTEAEFWEEMNKTADAIHAQVPNYDIKLMRPVGGYISADIQAICPYSIIMWSVDSDDWNNTYKPGDGEEGWNRKVDTIVNNVLKGLKDGDIILLHDIYESTYDATVILLARLYEMGYDVVSVSELLGETRPGAIYSRE